MTQPFLFVVAVALADAQGRVLLAQRPKGKDMEGLWEFPGGKVDPGETPEAALVREIKEELDLSLDPANLGPLTFASHVYPRFHLFMPLYLCRSFQGTLRAMEGQAFAWVAPENFKDYPMPPADGPLAAFLQKFLKDF